MELVKFTGDTLATRSDSRFKFFSQQEFAIDINDQSSFADLVAKCPDKTTRDSDPDRSEEIRINEEKRNEESRKRREESKGK